MKPANLILLGFAVFFVTAILRAPVSTVYAWAAPRFGDAVLQLEGLSGSVSRGRAAQVVYGGQPALRELDWAFQPLGLLLGRASFRLSGGTDGMLLDGTAFVVPSGTLTLSDFRLASPLKAMFAAAGQAFVPVEGQIGGDITRLKLRDNWPVAADGTLTVRGLAWKLGRDPVPLGDYEARIENETAGIKATIRSLGGALEVNGEGRVANDRSYELQLRMKPRADAPPMVPNLVKNLGQPDNQGWYHLRRTGQAPVPVEELPEEALPEDEAPPDGQPLDEESPPEGEGF
ncbi:MAG: type II secretion system protein N [Panacagrimonas sp.]